MKKAVCAWRAARLREPSLCSLFRAYVANRVSDKLTRVTDRIYCCRAGSSADTQAITDIVAYHLGFYE